MKNLLLTILLFAIIRADTLLITDFDSYSHFPWTAEYTSIPDNFEFVSRGVGSDMCAKFALDSGEYWYSPYHQNHSARSEISLKNTAPAETKIVYSWDFKVDSSYEETEGFQVVGQFHDIPDFRNGETWEDYSGGPPPISYHYLNGNIIVAVFSWVTESVWYIAYIPVSKGVWHNVKSEIYWSVSDSGYYRGWIDGVPIKSASGDTVYTARNLLNCEGCYLKIGLYRHVDVDTKGVVLFDNIVIESEL